MIELFQMKCFIAVAEELHFGRAAVRLFMTQPPLSRQIQLLEEAVGVQLLERSSRSVRLTAAGTVFYQDAGKVLALAEKALVSARRTASGEAGRVVIGYTALAGYSLIPDLVNVLKTRFPDIDIVLREMVSSEQQAALASHSVDLAFMRPVMSKHPFGYALVVREPMLLALPASHPLASKPRIALKDMAQQPFIMYSPQEGKYFHERIAGLFAASGVCPHYVQHIAQTHTILALVKAGIGLAIVPASAKALRLENIVYRPLWRKDVFAELYLAWPLEHRNPALDAVRQIVVEYRRAFQCDAKF
jgi:DNA-binding transcriptional LysR family regulator